jgi:biotin synthase
MLLDNMSDSLSQYAFEKARKKALAYFGNRIYIRGLIEISNYCVNDCYYCGIRKSNRAALRYRLKKEDILSCCSEGYDLGFGPSCCRAGKTHITTMIS